MGILTEDIQEVRERSDIVAVVSRYVDLKKDGRQLVGLCPFHLEKSGSFKVNPQKALFHCYGCKAGGDAITFIQEIEHVDFRTAVEILAERAGIQVRVDDTENTEAAKRRARLYDLMAKAVAYYSGLLLDTTNAEANAARAYWKSRGYTGDVARQFGIGWAPDAWDRLAKHLDVSPRELEAAGLGYPDERHGVRDAFRARLMFPIHDDRGRPIGFGARKLPDADGPKYRNSTEGPLYNKSRVLYGLHTAKQEIVRSGTAIVVEGYTDVIGLQTGGFLNTIATCGTALTEDHLRTLRRHAQRIVMCFDADDAGAAGMERMHQWERDLGVEAAVAVLPEGQDPAEIVAADPERMRTLVDRAVPLMRFRVDRAIAAVDTTTPEGKARAVDEAMEVVRSHPDPLVRDQYLADIATTLAVDPHVLRQRERSGGRPAANPPAPAAHKEPPGQTAPEGAAMAAIRIAVHRPEDIAVYLERVMFPEGLLRDTFDAMAAAATQAELLANADGPVRALLTEINVDDDRNENAVVVAADLALPFVRSGLLAASQMRHQPDVAPSDVLAEITRLTGWLDALQSDPPDPDTLAGVVAWIAGGCPVLGGGTAPVADDAPAPTATAAAPF